MANIPGDASFTGLVPGWIYVPWGLPVDSFSEPNRGITAQIALPRRATEGSGNAIHVTVRGQVMAPATVQIPANSTVLEAISKAGGFNYFAFTKRLQVIRVGGNAGENKTATVVRLMRHFRPTPGAKHQLVWYWPEKPESDSPVDLQMDFELCDGDELFVDRVI